MATIVRFPNLRYGNPEEFRFYAQGLSLKELSRRLRRDERTIRDYLSGTKRVPWWVPEVMRLQHMEHAERMRQMGMRPVMRRLGLLKEATVYQMFEGQEKETPPIVADEAVAVTLRRTG